MLSAKDINTYTRWSGRQAKMTVVYDTNEDGNIIVTFDSRWRFPETLGYSPKDPQYKALRGLWEKATGEKIQALNSPGIRGSKESYDAKKTGQR